jgi:hypothetical protein
MLPIDGLCDPDTTLILWGDPHDPGIEHVYCEVCGMFTPHRVVTSDGAAAKNCQPCISRQLRKMAFSRQPAAPFSFGRPGSA